MNQREAIDRFITENFNQLTNAKTTKQMIKPLRQAFFEKHKLSSECRFSNQDLAKELLFDIINAKKECDESELYDIINNIPFINSELTEEYIKIKINGIKNAPSLLTHEEAKRIRDEKVRQSVEEKLLGQVKSITEKALEKEKEEIAFEKKQIEQERKQIEKIKSQLESIPPDADIESLIESPSKEPQNDYSLWWKDLGLTGNPFSENRGLFGIPPNLYDQVVVQTPFIKNYISIIEENPDELLGKTYIVLGQYGSGKTTLFQMMAYKSLSSNIVPIIASVSAEKSPSRALIELNEQILSTLSDKYYFKIEDNSYECSPYEIGITIKKMNEIIKSNQIKGYIVFIDGLHKPAEYQDQALKILQQLQNYQERMSLSGVSCGIVIAGSLNWELGISANPSLSGSYHRMDKVPPLAEEYAIDAVINRINAFLPSGRPKISIARESLRSSFRILSTRLAEAPTFRDFFDHIKERFKSGEFDEMGIQLVPHTEIIDVVRKSIKNTTLATSYESLIDESKHTRRFIKAINRILLAILKKGKQGIPEDHTLFENNKGAFYVLNNTEFIEYHLDQSSGNINWFFSHELANFIKDMYDKFKISPENTLDCLFINRKEAVPAEAISIYSGLLKELKEAESSWRANWSVIADVIKRVIKRIYDIQKSIEPGDTTSSEFLLDNIQMSIKDLIKAVAYASGNNEALIGYDYQNIRSLWCSPEDTDGILNLLSRKVFPKDVAEKLGIISQHNRMMERLFEILYDLIRGESITRLNRRNLTALEKKAIHEARILFLDQQLEKSIDKMCDVLDNKIKDSIYTLMNCSFGYSILEKIPQDIKNSIEAKNGRGYCRTKRSLDTNFFYDVSRSEYIKIIMKKDCREEIFRGKLKEEDRSLFENSMALHFALEDREAHRDREKYFRDHATEIGDALQMTPRLCEIINDAFDDLISGPGFNFSFMGEVTIEYSFTASKNGKQRIDHLKAQDILFKLLNYLETGPVPIPPFEPLSNYIDYSPSEILCILKIRREKEFIKIIKNTDNFGYNLELTKDGSEKLSELIKIK